MPQAIYTAAKGLYESSDSDSGFSISGAGLYMQNQSVELSIPKYTLDLSGCPATTNEQGTDGNAGADDRTTKYSGSVLNLINGAGTTVRIEFESDENTSDLFASNNTGSLDAADGSVIPSASGTEDIKVETKETEGPADIAADLVTAINSSSTGLFAVDEGSNVVSIYVTVPTLLGSTAQTSVSDQSEVSILPSFVDLTVDDTTESLATLVVGDEGATSRSSTYINANRGTSQNAITTNAVHYCGWSSVDAADDIASMTTVLAFDDGEQEGQEKFIQYNASNTKLQLTGLFRAHGGVTNGTKLTIDGGSNHWAWLIWNGTKWQIANASDTSNANVVIS